jgi:hypothetical protein
MRCYEQGIRLCPSPSIKPDALFVASHGRLISLFPNVNTT